MTKKGIIKTAGLALLLTFCVSFYSCEKEGVFNPKQKISKVFTDVVTFNYEWDEETGEYIRKEFVYPKQLIQAWTWNDKKLDKIDFWGFYFSGWGDEWVFETELVKTDRYVYENDRLAKIDHGDGYFSIISYDGSKYKRLESYDDENNLLVYMDFIYDKNKISRIMIEEMWGGFIIDKNAELKLLATFIPKEFASKMVKKNEKNRNTKGINSVIYVFDYTYNGDNIKEIGVEMNYGTDDRMTGTINYVAYDNKNNPFYRKLEFDIDTEFEFGIAAVTSKNNPLEIHAIYFEDDDPEPYELSMLSKYSYSKNYPVEVEQIMTFNSLQSPTNKIYYEYK